MIEFIDTEDNIDFIVEIDQMFYGLLMPAMKDDIYIFGPGKQCTYSSNELRQIADKLDELNEVKHETM